MRDASLPWLSLLAPGRRARHQPGDGLAVRGRARAAGAGPARAVARARSAGGGARAGDRRRRRCAAATLGRVAPPSVAAVDRRRSAAGGWCRWTAPAPARAAEGHARVGRASSRHGRSSWRRRTARVSWCCRSCSARRRRCRGGMPHHASMSSLAGAHGAASAGFGGVDAITVVAPLVHTLGYLVTTVVLASVVYERIGVRVLRRAWINLISSGGWRWSRRRGLRWSLINCQTSTEYRSRGTQYRWDAPGMRVGPSLGTR